MFTNNLEKPKKARKDTIVYKILQLENEGIIAPCNYFVYEPYKLYKTEMRLTNSSSAFDDIAQHAMESCNKKLYSIGKGFHSAKYKKRLGQSLYNEDQFIVKCIIPKGSLYYTGLTNLIVSNQIIVTLETV